MQKVVESTGARSRPLSPLYYAGSRLVLSWLSISVLASAQASFPWPISSPEKVLFCNSEQLRATKQLTFRQRSCWYGSESVSPWAAVRAGISSGFTQWKDEDLVKHQGFDEFAHNFAVYYAKRSARETGELIAGYLNHEDPRPHLSGETLFGRRIRSAVMSVLVVTDDRGSRPALAPIVGSLGSAFAGDALYRTHHTGAEYALRGAGISYGAYVGRALYREFRPDISFLFRRITRKTGD